MVWRQTAGAEAVATGRALSRQIRQIEGERIGDQAVASTSTGRRALRHERTRQRELGRTIAFVVKALTPTSRDSWVGDKVACTLWPQSRHPTHDVYGDEVITLSSARFQAPE
jgi:hypothetical protein